MTLPFKNPIYTPSNQDITNESVTLTMTLQGEGGMPNRRR